MVPDYNLTPGPFPQWIRDSPWRAAEDVRDIKRLLSLARLRFAASDQIMARVGR
jgi:hypothetical protein